MKLEDNYIRVLCVEKDGRSREALGEQCAGQLIAHIFSNKGVKRADAE